MVVPCLGNALETILGHLKAVFPPAAACLANQGTSSGPGSHLAPSGTGVAADLLLDEDDEDDEGVCPHHM